MRIAVVSALMLAAPAWAHDGHGAAGMHLHGSDLLGLFILLAATAAALWIWRSGGDE
jgi:ABC-type enterobactin transport system permease subunit